EYIGIDMLPGPGVDQVIDGHDIKIYFQEGEFDAVVSTDTLEHDRAFWKTVENMRWVLKPGGWMVIAVPTLHCGLHEHPKDYWRFMQEGVEEFFEGFEDCYLETFTIAGGDLAYPDELMAWGRKPL
ncbi:MAG: class I SAM-dependent methyltransferase, partial [Nanoarchaeota archaeon]